MRGRLGLGLGLSLTSGGGVSLGPEIVLNGDFPTDTTDWVAATEATISVSSGQLRVESIAGAPGAGASQTQFTVLDIGSTYRFRVTMAPGNTADKCRVDLSSGLAGQWTFAEDGGTIDEEVVATGTNVVIFCNVASVSAWGGTGDFALFDNVSLKKVL